MTEAKVAITAAQVGELRNSTGAGMMDCKRALAEAGGDMEAAIDLLRKSGRVKAGKKAGRIAAEGAILIKAAGKKALMIEINSETDFVSRDVNFIEFANAVAQTCLDNAETDMAALAQLPYASSTAKTIEEARHDLVAKVGENVQLRRAKLVLNSENGCIGTYNHGNRIGVIVALDVQHDELAKDIAMHIAASKPMVIAPADIAADVVSREKEIYMAQVANSGKPAEIAEKMISGMIQKFLDEKSLLGQAFVKDSSMTVAQLLHKNRAKVLSFERFEVGEGIEKVVEDFRESVMSQVQGS